MKHARDAALDTIDPMLRELRTIAGMVEKKRGVFYRGARAFLHFHEDPKGLFADVRIPPHEPSTAHPSGDAEWQRLPANSVRERRTLLAVVKRELQGNAMRRP